MIRMMVLIPVVAALLACGLVARSDDPVAGVGEGSAAPIEKFAVQLDEPLPPPTGGRRHPLLVTRSPHPTLGTP